MADLPFFWQSVVVILTAGGLIYLLQAISGKTELDAVIAYLQVLGTFR
ncbi:Cytochrome c oxidase subunit CcoO [uncultured Candidatus Thioglobus sp.]|nr:Cytochrome c oxidase subunit CcoO [uncultured Candidatus Thioglobus sp.]